MKRVLVCGGRDYADRAKVYRTLDNVRDVDFAGKAMFVIEGGARGADSIASDWAWERGVHTARVEPLWHAFNKAAGHMRNVVMEQMLVSPGLVIAFPGGRGTADMIAIAKRQGHEVREIQP